MPLDTWLAFVAATMVLLLMPGPTILLVVSYAIGHGRKPALALAAGVALGDFTAMTASMLGLGALLMASSEIFTALRWLGGAYLIYMGIQLWRAPVGSTDADAPAASPARMFAHAYAVTALNPKSLVFFVSFVPLFVALDRPFLPQVATMETTFVLLAAANAAGYAILAAFARRWLRRPAVRRIVNRTGGTMLIGAGSLALGWRKA